MENTKEIWKPVVGYEGFYECSNMGRIRSLDRTIITKTGLCRKMKGKLITIITDNNGYGKVILSKNGVQKINLVHRIVAQAFILNPYSKPEIDHINTNRSDNKVSNLKWVTRKENVNNPITIKKLKHSKNTPILQFTKDGILVKKWDSIIDAGRTLGIEKCSIVGCCKNRPHYKTAGGFIWKYAS